MMQLLLGGVAGLTVLLRLYWQRFTTFIGVRKADAETVNILILKSPSVSAPSSLALFATVPHASSTAMVRYAGV
jgi:hypothetical protein